MILTWSLMNINRFCQNSREMITHFGTNLSDLVSDKIKSYKKQATVQIQLLMNMRAMSIWEHSELLRLKAISRFCWESVKVVAWTTKLWYQMNESIVWRYKILLHLKYNQSISKKTETYCAYQVQRRNHQLQIIHIFSFWSIFDLIHK